MGALRKIFNLIYIEVLTQYYCKKYGFSRKKADKVAKNKLYSKEKRRAARKVKILIFRRLITIVSLLLSLTVGTLLIGWVVSKVSGKRLINTVAYTVANMFGEDSDKMVLFSGKAECDLSGNEPLVIDASQFSKYSAKCDGTYRIKIEYVSYETLSLDGDKNCTVLAIDYGDSSTESVDEEEVEGETEESLIDTIIEAGTGAEAVDTVVGYIEEPYNTSNYEGDIWFEKSSITREVSEVYMVMNSSTEKILEQGIKIEGYNWVISSVTLEEVDKESDWTFGEYSGSSTTESGVSIGDWTPSDPTLNNWYSAIKDIQSACDNIGGDVSPSIVLGTILRETANSLPNELNNSAFDYNLLLTTNYTNGADTSSGVLVGSTNNGYGQFNKSTWDGQKRYVNDDNIASDLTYDAELGFNRPNCWYGRDQLWTTTWYSLGGGSASKLYKSISATAEYQSLQDLDRQFILGVIAERCHNRGSTNSATEEFVNKLIDIASNEASYGISSLYEMCDKAGVEVWSDEEFSVKTVTISNSNGHEKFDSVFGINSYDSEDKTPYLHYGYIEAVTAGYKCYNSVMSSIQTAYESETGGTTEVGTGNTISDMGYQVFSTWREEGFGYGYGKYVTSPTYGRSRIDCSGFVSMTLYQLGLVSSSTAYTSDDFVKNTMGYEVIGSLEELQAGDIVAWNGHVVMFAGYNSDGNRTWYSWGSDKSCKEKDIPDASYDKVVVKKNNEGSITILRVPM